MFRSLFPSVARIATTRRTPLIVQYWIQDPAGPLGFAASNALAQIAP